MEKKTRSKVLTIMLIDIVGYTNLSTKLDRESFNEMDDNFDRIALPIFESYNGWIVKKIGDSFMVAFESSTDSLLCAMELQNGFRDYNETNPKTPIRIKAALNSGEVTIKNNDVYGEPVNAVARLEKEAEPGQIIFSDSVFLSMNKGEIPHIYLGKRKMKGLKYPVSIFRVKTLTDDEIKARRHKKSRFWDNFWIVLILLVIGAAGYFGYLYLKSIGLF